MEKPPIPQLSNHLIRFSEEHQIGLNKREVDKGLEKEVIWGLTNRLAQKIVEVYGYREGFMSTTDTLDGGTNFKIDICVGNPAEVEAYATEKAKVWMAIINANEQISEEYI